MKRLLLPFIALLLFIWFAVGSYWYTKNHCHGTNQLAVPPLSIVDGSFEASSSENFSFQRNGHTLKVPAHAESAFRKLAVYLSDNPNKTISLAGIFGTKESNTSKLSNLGHARASAVKNKLIQLGAIKENIETTSLRIDNSRFHENTLYGGVYFTFGENEELTPAAEKEKVTAPVEEVIVKIRPLNLYFSSSKYKLEMTPELETYFSEVKLYLNEVPDSKVVITGHTDDKGKRSHNLRISKYRARAVRDFMAENGFSKKRIKVEYKGPDEPLMSNDTDEGRKKNRRVEVRVK